MGFFTTRAEAKKPRSTTPTRSGKAPGPKKQTTLALPIAHLHKQECKACTLDCAKAVTPKMEPTGAIDPVIYILGEAPTQEEDERGEQFVGPSGRRLRECFSKDVVSQLRFNNCIRTRPPKNATPTDLEIECCRPSIVRDIEETKPVAIFGFGNVPLKWAIGINGIQLWRGRRFPLKVGSHSCWFYPMLHPSFIIRNAGGRSTQGDGVVPAEAWSFVFDKDIERALGEINDLPEPVVEDLTRLHDDCKVLSSSEKIISKLLAWVKSSTADSRAAIDLETNCLRPYSKDARILTCSICVDGETIGFPIAHRSSPFDESTQIDVLEELFYFIMEFRGRIFAQNLAFELEWFAFFFGDDVLRVPRWGCTMQQAYCIDERWLGLDLGFLTTVQFGFNIKDQSNIDREKLDSHALMDVIKYNCLDSKYEYKLSIAQEQTLEDNELIAIYDEQVSRVPTLVATQLKGLNVNFPLVKKYKKELEAELVVIGEKIQKLPIVLKFIEQHKAFNPDSTKDTAIVFRDMLKRKEGWRGKSYSTDKEVLAKIDHPLSKMILDQRSTRKLLSTYVESLDQETGKYIHPDGKVHTTLNSTRASTGRLSSDNPNIQNFPVRKNGHIRSQICAPEDHVLVSCDYGQLEARLIGIASRDDYLCNSIRKREDIHKKWALRLQEVCPKIMDHELVQGDFKKLRHRAKNELVFPLFYGSVAESIGNAFEMGQRTARMVVDEFWEHFQGVLAWQKAMKEFFALHGYVECLTGRRRHAPLSDNMIINSPIQGTASDIVVDAMNRLGWRSYREERPQLQAVMNIHDDLTFYIPKASLDRDLETVVSDMLDVPYSWVNIPISIEVSMGPSWGEKTEVGTFFSDEVYDVRAN